MGFSDKTKMKNIYILHYIDVICSVYYEALTCCRRCVVHGYCSKMYCMFSSKERFRDNPVAISDSLSGSRGYSTYVIF